MINERGKLIVVVERMHFEHALVHHLGHEPGHTINDQEWEEFCRHFTRTIYCRERMAEIATEIWNGWADEYNTEVSQ